MKKLVARSRAEYLKELFAMASVVGQGLPSPDQIKHLRNLRMTYDELVAEAKALNTAIERGIRMWSADPCPRAGHGQPVWSVL